MCCAFACGKLHVWLLCEVLDIFNHVQNWTDLAASCWLLTLEHPSFTSTAGQQVAYYAGHVHISQHSCTKSKSSQCQSLQACSVSIMQPLSVTGHPPFTRGGRLCSGQINVWFLHPLLEPLAVGRMSFACQVDEYGQCIPPVP